MGLTRIAITRPVFILMLMLGAALMGAIAYRSMRVEQNPEVQFGIITVTSIYPGAGPEEVNTLVSRKMEEAISGVNGLLEVTSTSQEGVSVVAAQFDVTTDMNVALNDVRAKVDAIVSKLPRDVVKPTIDKFDSASSPVLDLVLKSDTLSNEQLRDLADEKIKDRFARIPGVAGVFVSGGDVRELQVQVKKDRLLAFGIGVVDLQRAVQAATLNVPSGRVVQGDREFSVRVMGEFQTPEELANMRLAIKDPNDPNAKAAVVRLGDVADVVDGVAERRQYSRLNGRDAVVLSIQKAREGNAIEISTAARLVVPQIEQVFGVGVIETFNQAKHISESLFDLTFALFFGIALVTAIVYVFLHNLRGTIIVGIAIPVCLLAALVVLWALGFTINSMSMLALSLAIGVLVDDCIVVLENIYRHLRMGENPVEAAINGRGEIGLAAIAITCADVVVFVPIAFMGGVVGQFFKPLGIGFAVAVLLSLFVSFTVTPMLASRWYRKGEDVEHPTGWFARRFDLAFHGLERMYRRRLEWALRHRWFVFISGFVALIGVFMMIRGGFAPTATGAALMGMGPALAVFAVGLAVFGIRYFIALDRPRLFKRVYFASFLVAASFLAIEWDMWGPATAGLAPAPVLGALLAAAIALVLLGPAALLPNLRRPRVRSRLISNGLLFGLCFPAFAVLGHYYGQWKGDAIFKFQFMPESDGGQVVVKVELPPGSSLPATQRTIERIEEAALAHPDVKYVVSNVGFRGGGFSAAERATNYGEVRLTLYERAAMLDSIAFWINRKERLRTKRDTAVAAEILQRLGRLPGAITLVSAGSTQGFGSPIQMSFASDDRELLIAAASRIRERLQQGEIKGVISPELSSKPGKPEIRAIPDRTLLADADLTAAEVANTMRILYEGDNLTKFRVRGREYDIRVMMALEDRNDPNLVGQVPITFRQGNPIYLDQVARIVPGTSVDKIERRNRGEEVRITTDLLPGFAAGSVQAEINGWLKKENLIPAGVKKKDLGQADVQARESRYLIGALALGLVLVYMVLASLYDNLLYPFIIQLAQPQAVVGALLALILTDKSLNIVGFVGIIALVGLVGKNAILLVDYTNTLRARGRNRHDALVEAGPVRLRPIMMTTLAVILGMLPVALAIGRGSEFRETIGITIIGGITLSTLLTLLVIPCSYTIFDDVSVWVASKIFRRPPPAAPADTVPEATGVALS